MENAKSFADIRLGVLCCSHVFRKDRSVLLVAHEEDGDWQFFCGAEDHTGDDDVHHVCVGYLVDFDSTIEEVADLPRGWEAKRASTEVEWLRRLCRFPSMMERFQGLELDASEKNVLGHIERHGWNVMNIREQEGEPGWSFTIGLFENYGHPEVVIFGLEPETRHSVLNRIGQNIRDGRIFSSGKEHDWVLKHCGCWSRDVQQQWYRDILGGQSGFTAERGFLAFNVFGPQKMARIPGRKNPSSSPHSRCCMN